MYMRSHTEGVTWNTLDVKVAVDRCVSCTLREAGERKRFLSSAFSPSTPPPNNQVGDEAGVSHVNTPPELLATPLFQI